MSVEINEVNRIATLAQQHSDRQFVQENSTANQALNLSHDVSIRQERRLNKRGQSINIPGHEELIQTPQLPRHIETDAGVSPTGDPIKGIFPSLHLQVVPPTGTFPTREPTTLIPDANTTIRSHGGTHVPIPRGYVGKIPLPPLLMHTGITLVPNHIS